jgi:hypothetical protein
MNVTCKDKDPLAEETNGEQIYHDFFAALSKHEGFKVNWRTREKLRILRENYHLSQDDILQELLKYFYSSGYPEKHDAQRSCISTFIVAFVDRCLDNLIDKASRRSKRTGTPTNFDTIGDEFLYQHGQWDGVEWMTPEDHLRGKQFLEGMLEHYGELDTAVLLRIIDRRAAAQEMELSYDAYCKRLTRKTLAFIDTLSDAGYH